MSYFKMNHIEIFSLFWVCFESWLHFDPWLFSKSYHTLSKRPVACFLDSFERNMKEKEEIRTRTPMIYSEDDQVFLCRFPKCTGKFKNKNSVNLHEKHVSQMSFFFFSLYFRNLMRYSYEIYIFENGRNAAFQWHQNQEDQTRFTTWIVAPKILVIELNRSLKCL